MIDLVALRIGGEMEGVQASRTLGAVYRRAVRELDDRGLRSFMLARAEMLIHFVDTDSLEVFLAEHVNQVVEIERLLADTLALNQHRRRGRPTGRGIRVIP